MGAAACLLLPGVLAAAPPVGADAITADQGQIAQVQAEIQATAVRVHQLTTEYDADAVALAAASQQLAADRAALSAAGAAAAAGRRALARAALSAYTGAGATAGADGASGAAALDPGVGQAYLGLAVGDVGDQVDSYRLRERQLQAATATVAADQARAQQASAAAGAARRAALADAGSAQGRLVALQADLGRLEAQAAAQAAAARAAAAQAAAARAAAARAAAPPPTPAPPTAAPTAQGGPVPGALVDLVGHVVAPTPSPAPAPPTTSGGGAGGPWLQLRECESGDDYRADTGNGFYGAYQFTQSTWTGMGYPGRPDQEPPAMQDQAAMRLQAEAGWGQWPACSAALGLG